MFKVEAIVRPAALEDVKYGLDALGCDSIVVSDVQGNADHPGRTASYRGVKYDLPLVHQLRIEVCVTDTMLDAVVDRIANTAHTGQPGDGKIFVSQLAEVIDIGLGRPPETTDARVTSRPGLAATSVGDWPSA